LLNLPFFISTEKIYWDNLASLQTPLLQTMVIC